MRYEALMSVDGIVEVARGAKNGDSIRTRSANTHIENGRPVTTHDVLVNGKPFRTIPLVKPGAIFSRSTEIVDGRIVTLAFRLRKTGHRTKPGEKVEEIDRLSKLATGNYVIVKTKIT